MTSIVTLTWETEENYDSTARGEFMKAADEFVADTDGGFDPESLVLEVQEMRFVDEDEQNESPEFIANKDLVTELAARLFGRKVNVTFEFPEIEESVSNDNDS